jgi:uncharacterized protein (TIGR02301 family)
MHSAMRSSPLIAAFLAVLLMAGPARAVDPPYQAEMERLSEILGSLYFLGPLCRPENATDWRQQAGELIGMDEPDEDRRQRLAGAFNAGYEAYSRFYRVCTISAEQAFTRLLVEAEKTAREIHSRYAE